MTRLTRIVPLLGLLAVLTGCPALPVAFTITLSPVVTPPLPPGGVFSKVVWTGYLVRDLGDGGDTQTIPLGVTTLYPPLGDFSYSDAREGDDLHIMVQADWTVPNPLDPTHPTVYHVVGQKVWTLSDTMNAGVPMTFFLPVHE
jgi:hypothetical protein